MTADRYQHNDFVFKTITALRILVGVAVTLAVLFVMVCLIDYSSTRSKPASDKPVLMLPDHSGDRPETGRQDQTFFESLLRKRSGKQDNSAANAKNVPHVSLPDEIDSKNTGHSSAVSTSDAPSENRPVMRGTEPQSAESAFVYVVQLGSFQQVERARVFSEKLAARGYEPYIMNIGAPDGTTTYRVRVGRFATREEAKDMAAHIERAEKISVFVTSQ